MHIAREKGLLGEYYGDRLELIDHMHELSRRVARMKLLGVAAWDKEDYELAYAIKNGIVKLPTGALFDPDSYMLDGKNNNAGAIQRGLFNVHRYTQPRLDKWKYQDPFPSLPITDAQNSNFASALNGYSNPLSGTAALSTAASRFAQGQMDASQPPARFRPSGY